MTFKLERISESEYKKQLENGEIGDIIEVGEDKDQIEGQSMFSNKDLIKESEEKEKTVAPGSEEDLKRKTFILTLDLIQAIKRMVANESLEGENEFIREFLYRNIPDKYFQKY